MLIFLDNPWLDASVDAAIGLVIALICLFTFTRYAKGHKRCRKCWYILKNDASRTCPECGHDNTGVKNLAANQYRWRLPAFVLLLGLTSLAYVSFAYAHMHYTAWRWDRPGVEIHWHIDNAAWWQKPGSRRYGQLGMWDPQLFAMPNRLIVSDLETLPDDLPATTSLQHVNVENIRSADVSWFEQFDRCKITSLILSDVNLTRGKVGSGRWATHLVRLSLGNARIGPGQLVFLEHSSNLKYYLVSNDKSPVSDGWYDSMPLAAMKSPATLRMVGIRNGRLRVADFKAIADQSGGSLEMLQVENCAIDDGFFEQVVQFSSLQGFYAEGMMTDKRLSQIIAGPQLRDLYIGKSKVTPDGLKQLVLLPSLKELSVRGCDFDAAALQPLAACPRLSVIRLDGSQLKLEHAAMFKSFKSLNTIYVGETGLEDEQQIVEAFAALGITVEAVAW